MNKDYISLKAVLNKIMEHPMLREVSIDVIIDYTLELIQIVGSPSLFYQKEATVKINNYRGKLPCDFYDMKQVFRKEGGAFIYSTSTLEPKNMNHHIEGLTYKIQGNIIYTSIKEGEIYIAYRAIALDEESYPLILNNASFLRALEYYIKMRHFEILFDQSKIPANVMEKAERDYYGYISQAETSLMMPSIDEMESLKNIMNSFVTHYNDHASAFNNINKEHTIKNY